VSADVSFFETRPFFPSTPKEPNDSGPSQFSSEFLTIPIAPTPVSIPTPDSTPSPAPQDSSLAPSDSRTPHPTPELPIALRK
ncbi:hypothetical protein A2U01_0071153, partial [Trifolium medium]|nr:hypothetical protein [Trifolium medium]